MKQLWLLNHYANGPSDAGGTRHFHLAEGLKAYGWQTTIIAASVDHVTGQQRLKPEESHRLESLEGVLFLWVNTPAYNGNGAGRVRNMLAYTLAVFKPKTTVDLPSPDVVIGSSVHPFAALAGALLARRHKVPFIFEVRDLWPQTLIDMGRLKEGTLTLWALRKLELWLYRRAARTIVLLPLAWQYIVPLGIAKQSVVWIPNGVDLSLYHPRVVPPRASEDGVFTLMYFGSHGQANGLDNVLEAMALIQDRKDEKQIRLRLIGDGPLKCKLQAQAESMGLRNVQFESPVPKREIPALATQADAFVITIPNLPKLYRFGVSPNKLFDYLAADRPIIIASDIANNPVAEAKAGIVVPPSKPKHLAAAILQMANTSIEDRQVMGRSGREYVETNHSFVLLARRLANTLDSVT